MRFDLSRYNRTLTHTNVKFGRRGEFIYNGIDAKTDVGSDFIGVLPVTVEVWIKARSTGEGSAGKIVDNGTIFLAIDSSPPVLVLTSNGGGIVAVSPSGSIRLNEWLYVVATRTSLGVANLYIDGNLSGAANQNSGTPAAGSTNVFVGNNSGATRTFDGSILLRVYNEIWPASRVAYGYNKQKRIMF